MSVATSSEEDPSVKKLASEVALAMKSTCLDTSTMYSEVTRGWPKLEGPESCHVLLPNETSMEIVHDGDTTVGDAIHQLAWKIGCRRPENFAFVLVTRNSKEMLDHDESLKKVLNRRSFRKTGNAQLLFRRVMFRLSDQALNDQDYTSLLFAQAKSDYLNGDYAIPDKDVLNLCIWLILAEHEAAVFGKESVLETLVHQCIPNTVPKTSLLVFQCL